MQHFVGLSSEAEIKERYKDLAKRYHPDLGGCVETMKEVNAQYELCMEGVYQKAGMSISEIDELLEKDKELREKLSEIVYLFGLNIEICGAWLWVTGDTKTHKDILKSNGFFWSNKKVAWYWRAEVEKKHRYRGSKSLEEIRATYGSLNVRYKAQGALGCA